MLNIAQCFPITDPTLIFFVVLCIILLAPIIMGKLRIPHIIGMVLAGMIIGQYGLNVLQRDSSFELFGKVGLYYIMFLAGLEIDMQGLRNNGVKVVTFGLITFFIPFIMVYAACVGILGYSSLASLLLSSIMGSNTLIAYPIVCKYGLQKHPSVTLSVGGGMVALALALVVLAAVVGAFNNGTSIGFWILFVLKFVAFLVGSLYLIPRLVRKFLRRYSDAVMQYIFVMAVMFLSAAVCEALSIEGVFGAFFSGLVLNRYIPHISPLMNRIEFIGNALFIPYFLIGVGMLINIRVLQNGWHMVLIIAVFAGLGTLGKLIAAYITSYALKRPRVHGDMMLGLTAAHAAGSIAIVMVGINLRVDNVSFLMNDDMLNGVVMMILVTCVIASVVTENASQKIVLKESSLTDNADPDNDDEKILMPVKYPETAETILNIAMLMKNQKLDRDIVGLNVVFDDENRIANQERGKRLLEKLEQVASSADVKMQTQVRIATNIANGIKHAFKEFNASEIIMGMHIHKEISTKFWGEFIQSLFNGMNRQIILARCVQPLNTIRRIQVAVPSRAEFEPGFYRWLERLARLSENLECRIIFHAKEETNMLINEYMRNKHKEVRTVLLKMAHWNELPNLASTIHEDHLFVVVTARKGTVSYKVAQERLPDELTQHFSGKNLMIIFPDQYGDAGEAMTFTTPQHTEQRSAYNVMLTWIKKKFFNYD